MLVCTDFSGEGVCVTLSLLDYLWRLVMGNAAAGGLEQEPAEGREARNSAGAGADMSDPASTLQKKQPAPPKLPMPPEDELEERFGVVLVSGCEKKA